MYDVTVVNHGTLHLVHPETSEAREWLHEHCPGSTVWGNATVVEPRYTVDLLLGLRDAGFSVPLEARTTS